MSSEDKERLINAGVDMPDALARFMDNEMLYGKFLKLFLADTSFSNLRESILNKDLKTAYSFAHTLKGVASNLSFRNLIDALMPIHNSLKEEILKDYSFELSVLNQRYDEITDIIKEMK